MTITSPWKSAIYQHNGQKAKIGRIKFIPSRMISVMILFVIWQILWCSFVNCAGTCTPRVVFHQLWIQPVGLSKFKFRECLKMRFHLNSFLNKIQYKCSSKLMVLHIFHRGKKKASQFSMEMLCIYLLQHKIIHLSKTAVKAGYIILGNKPAILQELFCRR